MPAVSNTSPLLGLAIIGELRLIRDQFEIVLIPEAVREELRIDEDRPGSIALRGALEEEWIRVRSVENQHLAKLLQRDLDRGESEAIALAVEVGAPYLLLDEREGRRRARSLDVNVIGALGILARAQREGRLASLDKAVADLKKKAGFRISAALEKELLYRKK